MENNKHTPGGTAIPRRKSDYKVTLLSKRINFPQEKKMRHAKKGQSDASVYCKYVLFQLVSNKNCLTNSQERERERNASSAQEITCKHAFVKRLGNLAIHRLAEMG